MGLSSMAKVQERAAKGDYTLVEPLDYKLLELLPEVGALFAGLYPIGETVKNLAAKMPKHEGQSLPTNIVYGRIRSLEVQGLVAHNKGPGSGRIWQRTARGTAAFKKWKEKSGVSGSK